MVQSMAGTISRTPTRHPLPQSQYSIGNRHSNDESVSIRIVARESSALRTVVNFLALPPPPAVHPHANPPTQPCSARGAYSRPPPPMGMTEQREYVSNEIIERVNKTLMQCQCAICCGKIIDETTRALEIPGTDRGEALAYRKKAHWLLGNHDEALSDASMAAYLMSEYYSHAVIGLVRWKRGEYCTALRSLLAAVERHYPISELKDAIAECKQHLDSSQEKDLASLFEYTRAYPLIAP